MIREARASSWSLSVWGGGPFCAEIVKRRDDPGVAVHLFQPAADCKLDDEAAWRAANPGLAAGIKSLDYMRAESRRVQATPADQPSLQGARFKFAANSGARNGVFPRRTWSACVVDKGAVSRSAPGRVSLGFDAGRVRVR